jgi:proline iminopeptidase
LRHIFPEAWRTFSGYIPEAERGDLLGAYYKRLTHPDPAVHMPAARCWSVYEGSCSTLLPNPALVADFASDRVALGLARIEAHYFMNDIFLPEDFLMKNVGKLKSIPGVIVQGRYDIVCPAMSADDLHYAWPEAEYHVVSDAGHSAFEPGIRSRLLAATEGFKARLTS